MDWRGVGLNPAGNTYFPFEFSLSLRFQVSGAHVNEIKHDHSPVVIVVLVLDAIKALYIYSRSIALRQGFLATRHMTRIDAGLARSYMKRLLSSC